MRRADAEVEVPILWPCDVKSWLIRKDRDAEKDWRHEEKETTEDEMAGWHHQLNAHEFEQAPGDGEGQGSLVCCSPWGHKEVGHDWVTEKQQQGLGANYTSKMSASKGSSKWKPQYFLYKFIYFNWRLITLEYCSGFVIHWHESAKGIHVFPILNPHPTSLPIPSLWVIPVHQPWAPCIEAELVISFTYDNIHVSILFSQIIPPLPFPTESKSLFFTSVSLLLPHI